MIVALYQKTRYGKYYITDYKNNIEYSNTTAFHLATFFDTEKHKDDIEYLTTTFGFNFKIEKVSKLKVDNSKALNRVYI